MKRCDDMKKVCEKLAFMAGLITLVTILTTPMVVADGMFVSEEYLHLYEPYQKAVIYWDGFSETLILSSAVKTYNLTDIAWIVPIISTTMPNVTAGDMSAFRDLVDYFKELEYLHYYGWMRDVILANGKNVTVLESKEIDIYDVVILKATSASDLINWLVENNFNVSKEAYPLIEKYVNMNNCYFVINKIDLKNRFQKVLEEIENGTIPYSSSEYREYQDVLLALNQGMATPLKFKFTPIRPYYPLIISSLSAGYGIIEVYFIGEQPAIDKNNMLKVEECKEVNLSLREKLSKHFSVEKADYVTRLSFYGELKDLVDDAEFTFHPLSKPELLTALVVLSIAAVAVVSRKTILHR